MHLRWRKFPKWLVFATHGTGRAKKPYLSLTACVAVVGEAGPCQQGELQFCG
jgi:hypothetical protein